MSSTADRSDGVALSKDDSGQPARSVDEPAVVRALQEYRAAQEAGKKPSRQSLLARYPQIAKELSACLDALDFVQQAASQLAPVTAARAVKPAPVGGVQPDGVLGDFRILREVGRGGMGVVYEAEQVSLGRRVALKVLPFASTLDARQLQRFKNEAQAAAHLHHTNIVPVHAVGFERGVHYYAMQFIEGQTLAQMIEDLRRLAGLDREPPTPSPVPKGPGSRVRKGSADPDATGPYVPSSPTQPKPQDSKLKTTATAAISTEHSTRDPSFFRTVANLGVQAAEALEHAHQLGIVHRDIKPANLMVETPPLPAAGRGAGGEGLRLWITDFGLAHIQSDTRLTMTGDILGTIRYMSPEQALGQRDVLDHRTDVYSLGATLYEVLTLEPAFPSTDRQAVLRQIAFEEPKKPRRINKSIPAELETIVLKAMAKSPAERYASAQELADDLRRFLADEPIRARRPTLAQRVRKWARRHRGIVTTAAVSGVVLLLATVAGLLVSNVLISHQRDQKDEALKKANEKEKLANENSQKADTQRGIAVKNELLAKRRFYAAQINLAHQAYEAGDLARTLSILETQRPRFDEDDLRTFEWYCLWKLCHQRLRFSWQLKSGNTYAVACSPDGSLLACGGSDGKVRLFDTATGQERTSLQEKSYGARAIAFSPDGRLLAQAAGPTEDEVTLWDVAAGRQHSTLKGTGKVSCLAFAPDGMTLATATGSGDLQLWDVAAGERRAAWQTNPPQGGALAFSPDSKVVATSHPWSSDPLTQLWDVTTDPPKSIQKLPGAYNLAFSPDGKVLSGAIGGAGLGSWDLASGKEVPKKKSLNAWGTGNALAYSPDGKFIAVGVDTRCVKLLEVATGQEQTLPHHTMVKSVAFSGKLLASVSEDGVLKLWDLSRTQEPDSFQSLRAIGSLAISPDSKTLATGSSDNSVRLYDLATLRLKATFSGHTYGVQALAFSPDGRMLASGGGRSGGNPPGELKLWDLATENEVVGFPKQEGAALAVVFSPDSRTLAFGGWSATGRLWDLAAKQPLATWQGDAILALVFSPDGKTLASAGSVGSIDFRSATTGQKTLSLKGLGVVGTGHLVPALACSPDGKILAAGDSDGTIWLWDFATGRLRGSLRGHTSRIGNLGFFSDSSTLASADQGGTAKLWDVTTGQERLTLKQAGRFAVAPDGKTLAIANGLTVQLLRVATDQEALAYRNELDPSDPESPVAQANVGDLLWTAGRADEAKDAYEAARPRLEKLAAHFPDNADYQRELARNAMSLALVHSGSDEARLQARELFQKLSPDDQQALARRCTTQAESLREAGRAQDAEKAYSLAIELKPDDPSVWFRRGYYYGQSAQHEKALADYSKVLELEPKWAGAWNNRGVIYAGQGQLDKALAEYSKAVELAPKDVLPWRNRAGIYKRLRQWEQAIADYSKVIELTPNDAAAWKDRAQVYKELRQWEQVAADYSKTIELKPAESSSWFERGLAYFNLRQPDKAAEDFSKVIVLDEKNAAAWNNRGAAHEQLRQLDQALADYSKAVELAANTALYWYNRGRIHKELQQFKEALTDFDQAVELNQKYAEAWRERALTHADLKHWNNAATDLSKLIDLKPQDWSPRRMRGYVYAKLDRWDEAAADFAKAVELARKDPAASVSVGDAYRDFSRWDEAIRHYSKAIELKPEDANGWFQRGVIRGKMGQWDQAVADYSAAIERAPSPVSAWPAYKERGQAYVQLGRFPEAQADYQKVLELRANSALAHNNLAWFLATCPDAKFRDPARAVELANKATELSPKNWLYWNTLGIAHYRAGDWKAAIDAMEKSIELNPGGSAFDHLFLAMSQQQLANKDEARKWYDRALEWLEKNKESLAKDSIHAEELRRFHAEAAELLKVKD